MYSLFLQHTTFVCHVSSSILCTHYFYRIQPLYVMSLQVFYQTWRKYLWQIWSLMCSLQKEKYGFNVCSIYFLFPYFNKFHIIESVPHNHKTHSNQVEQPFFMKDIEGCIQISQKYLLMCRVIPWLFWTSFWYHVFNQRW